MYFLGVDPDTHNCAFAFIDSHGKVAGVYIAKTPSKLEGRDAAVAMTVRIRDLPFDPRFTGPGSVRTVAVESQEAGYSAKQNVPPQRVVQLAWPAGMALFAASCLWECPLLFPAPQAWKGSVPKPIHQARIIRELGWEFYRKGDAKTGFCVPLIPDGVEIVGASEIKEGQWKHVVDAIGLAKFAKERYDYNAAVTASTGTRK